MIEKDFVVGSVLSTGDQLFLKVGPGDWSVFGLEADAGEEEMDETLDVCSDIIEVLASPDPVDVLESLPSGSVVLASDAVAAAVKFEQGWTVSGTEGWYGSATVLERLGNDFEVVRRGGAD